MSEHKNPPGPPGALGLRNLHGFSTNSLSFLTDLKGRYGDTVRLKLLGKPWFMILLSQWVVHRDPRWFPNPEAFDPDRWKDQDELPRFAYFPFGGGPRICIGNHFAMMEATLLLTIMMQRYRLDLLPGERLSLAPSVTLRQQGPGLRMRVVERTSGARASGEETTGAGRDQARA